MRLTATDVSYAYVRGEEVLRGVSLSLRDGEVSFILGPNGSGKTTLLQCLSGLREPTGGSVAVDGRPLAEWTPRERAQRVGVIPQLHEPAFAFTVAEVVLMGRAPYLGLFARPGPTDRKVADQALLAAGVLGLRNRPYTEISGGERQLVLIARGLAQGAGCLLMDEPAAHLDPRHQHAILSIARDLATGGRSFVVTSHQPASAFLYADSVLLLVRGMAQGYGRPVDVLTEASLRAAYEMEFEILRGTSGTRAVIPRVSGPSPS